MELSCKNFTAKLFLKGFLRNICTNFWSCISKKKKIKQNEKMLSLPWLLEVMTKLLKQIFKEETGPWWEIIKAKIFKKWAKEQDVQRFIWKIKDNQKNVLPK